MGPCGRTTALARPRGITQPKYASVLYPAMGPLLMTIGDYRQFQVSVTLNSSPYDLSGVEGLTFTLQRTGGTVVAEWPIGGGVVLTNPTAGIATLTITPSMLWWASGWQTLQYFWGLVDGSGNPSQIVEVGIMQLVPSPMGTTPPTPPAPPPPVYVRVNANGSGGAKASPYTAFQNQVVIADTSQGSVVINLPALVLGQSVTVTQDASTAWAGGTSITVNGPSGVEIQQPVPNNTVFASSFVFPLQPGIGITWYDGGSPGGLLIQ